MITELYWKINGYYIVNRNNEIGINTALNFSIDDALETIDRIRGPLAEKRLEGKQFSESESVNLKILDSLTDKILSLLTPKPEESAEVRLALEYAKRIDRNP